MLNWWQNLPLNIDPIAFSIGSFSVYWYSLMYLVGFAVVYGLLRYRIWEIKSGTNQKLKCKNQNDNEKLKNDSKIQNTKYQILNTKNLPDLMLYLIIGLLVGARLGYVFFYDFGYYSNHILEIFLPIKITDYGLLVTGYYGMSYHGGLLGVLLAGYIFVCRRIPTLPNQKIWRLNLDNFLKLADFVAPAVPAGYFFGRIGNFFNGELYGRATDMPWGMYFPADPFILRHPSQLYEAFFEGLILFLIIWTIKNGSKVKGQLLIVYLFFYSFFRFFIEFFREPDEQIGYIFGSPAGGLTLGQIFSLGLILLCAILWYNKRKISRSIT